jgi:anti-sigma factor RsiW
MMTCREVYGFLDDFLDGQIDALVRLKFEAHLVLCGKCRAYLATYKAAVEAARGSEVVEAGLAGDAPDQLIRAILATRAWVAPRLLPE